MWVLLSVYWITLACSPSHCECVELLKNANKQIQDHAALNTTEALTMDSDFQRSIVQYEGVQKNEKTGVATIQDDPAWFTERVPSSLSKATSACIAD